MGKDTTAFRERFNAYKNGKSVSEIYDAGLPRYGGGKSGFSESTKKSISNLHKILKAKGFDDISAAGIIGNAIQESSLNPDSVNSLGYSGIFQNSKQIRKAIEEQYGDYSLESQLRYLDDWVSGNTWIRKGKYRDWTATGSKSFKRTGYKTAHEASDAFMKLYERPVIMDAKGNIIGYQDWDKRKDYSQQVYDYITGSTPVVVQEPLMSQTTAAELNAASQFQPWQNYHQPDYPLNNPAPSSISSWNNPKSPAYTTAGLQARRIDFGKMMMDMLEDDWEPPTIQPLKTITPPDSKISTFTGFKNGKLPGYKDGMKYSWDDQEQKWNRYTGDSYGDVFADFVVTPRGGAHKKDIEPLKIVSPEQEEYAAQNQPIISSDNNLYTRNRIAESNKPTWRSYVADQLRGAGEGAMLMSTIAAPEMEPLLFSTYNKVLTSIKNRAAAALYRNVMPASYSESYMPYGKLEEVANAAADFLSPFKKLELTNKNWKSWLDRRMPIGFNTDATAARDEIYRKYLGLPNENFYYVQNPDGILSHNIKNHNWFDIQKQIESAEANDQMLRGVNTNASDIINSAGGTISQSIKQTSPTTAIYKYNDVWDVNPFLDPARMGNILPKSLVKKYTHLNKDGNLVWNEKLPTAIKKLKNFELSDLTNGKPQPVNTDVNVRLLNADELYYDRKMSDSEIIKEMADTEFDYYSNLVDEWNDDIFNSLKKQSFQRSMKAFLENPDKYRGVFNRKEPYTPQELYDVYGHYLRRFKDGKSPIYIKPANRGKLTRLKSRTGKSESELYNDGNPAHKKMVVFARNARKWHH